MAFPVGVKHNYLHKEGAVLYRHNKVLNHWAPEGDDFRYALIDNDDGAAIAVSGGLPATLRRIVCYETIAGATFTVKDGTVLLRTITAATLDDVIEFYDLRCATSLIIEPTVAGTTGILMAQYR